MIKMMLSGGAAMLGIADAARTIAERRIKRATNILDGSVSYSLEWNGLKYVFGGDTYPNQWYMKYAAGADVATHECFLPPEALAAYFGWDLKQATYVSTRVHTEPKGGVRRDLVRRCR